MTIDYEITSPPQPPAGGRVSVESAQTQQQTPLAAAPPPSAARSRGTWLLDQARDLSSQILRPARALFARIPPPAGESTASPHGASQATPGGDMPALAAADPSAALANTPANTPPARGGDEAAAGKVDRVLSLDVVDSASSSYSLAKIVTPLAAHDPGSVARGFQQQAQQLAQTPQTWLQGQSGALGSPTDLAMGVSLDAASIPVTLFSLAGGIAALRKAWAARRSLAAKRAQAAHTVQALKSDSHGSGEPANRLALTVATQSLGSLDEAVRQNRDRTVLGAGSIGANTALLSYTANGIVMESLALGAGSQAGLAGLVSAALPSLATAAGIAGTLALGPLAMGLFAAVAGLLLHHSRRGEAAVRADRKLLEGARPAPGALDGVGRSYFGFIDRKFGARARFARLLKRWSGGYFLGACLFAAGIIGKAVLGAAALAGVALLVSNPAGLAVLGVLAIVAGFALSIGSWQFVAFQAKRQRQDAYRFQESPLLSRQWDALHAACCWMGSHLGRSPRAAVSAGEECALRSSLHRYVHSRDRARQSLLQLAASETGKHHRWQARSGETAVQESVPGKRSRRLKDVPAACLTAGLWLGAMLAGRGRKAARDAALQGFARASDRLTVTGLAHWLERSAREPASAAAQALRAHLRAMLEDQQAFLRAKLARSREVCAAALERMSPAARAVFAPLAEEQRADEARLAELDALLTREPPCSLETLEQELPRLQGYAGPVADAGNPVRPDHRLARCLLHDMATELTVTRGILFDMHRQSLHLRERIGAGAIEPSNARDRAPASS